jgi:hypothetical protein
MREATEDEWVKALLQITPYKHVIHHNIHYAYSLISAACVQVLTIKEPFTPPSTTESS